MITDLLDWVVKTDEDFYLEDFQYDPDYEKKLPPGYTIQLYIDEMVTLEGMLRRIQPLLYHYDGLHVSADYVIIDWHGKEIEISVWEGQGTDIRISTKINETKYKHVLSWDTFCQAAKEWSRVDQASYFINYIYSNGFTKIDEKERYELYYYLGMYSHLGFFEALELYKNIKNRG